MFPAPEGPATGGAAAAGAAGTTTVPGTACAALATTAVVAVVVAVVVAATAAVVCAGGAVALPFPPLPPPPPLPPAPPPPAARFLCVAVFGAMTALSRCASPRMRFRREPPNTHKKTKFQANRETGLGKKICGKKRELYWFSRSQPFDLFFAFFSASFSPPFFFQNETTAGHRMLLHTSIRTTFPLLCSFSRRVSPEPRLEPLEHASDGGKRAASSSSSAAHLPRRPRRAAGEPHRRQPELVPSPRACLAASASAAASAEPHRRVCPPEPHRRQETASTSQDRRGDQPGPLRELRRRREAPELRAPRREEEGAGEPRLEGAPAAASAAGASAAASAAASASAADVQQGKQRHDGRGHRRGGGGRRRREHQEEEQVRVLRRRSVAEPRDQWHESLLRVEGTSSSRHRHQRRDGGQAEALRESHGVRDCSGERELFPQARRRRGPRRRIKVEIPISSSRYSPRHERQGKPGEDAREDERGPGDNGGEAGSGRGGVERARGRERSQNRSRGEGGGGRGRRA